MPAALRRLLLSSLIWRHTRGQELMEYALLLGLLSTAAVALLPEIVESFESVFSNVRRALEGRLRHGHH